MLVTFSGPSGVGKNTIINRLLQDSDKFVLMPTCTTRAMRENESEGNPYHFITIAEFEKKLQEGEFYEHERVHNNYYGTSKKLLAEGLKKGKILVKDIDVLGVQNLVKTVGKDIKIVTIYLTVDLDALQERLKGRGEKDIELRLSRFQLEESHSKNFNYVIKNIDLETTLQKIYSIVEKESKQ